MVSVHVYVGSAGSSCIDLSSTLLIVSGLPSSLAQLDAWGANPAASDPALLLRQSVSLTCDAQNTLCSSWECLTWQTVALATPVAVTANNVVSFALVALQPSSPSSTPVRVRVGVVPSILGSSGHSSLLVSPIFQVREMERIKDGRRGEGMERT